MIDPATGWFEIEQISDKKADEIANILEMTWLTRYPWPTEVVMDRGKEFVKEVSDMLRDEWMARAQGDIAPKLSKAHWGQQSTSTILFTFPPVLPPFPATAAFGTFLCICRRSR